ncbi:MAG: hypothetical protein JW881_19125 [Spirochaetales bacterium]|nr:hypothetical protein [Spirochaetales bacterium]
MKKISAVLLACVIITFLWGCMTPRLGYPAATIGIPTDITLFSTIVQKEGKLKLDMDIVSKGLFQGIYKAKYEKMLDDISPYQLQRVCNDVFLENALSSEEIFSIDDIYVYNWDIEYSKLKESPDTYSGYDFSPYREKIETPYILSITIDEWGYIVSQDYEKDGPYISITIQLIDRDSGITRWSHNAYYHESTKQESHNLVTLEMVDGIYEKLIAEAVTKFFKQLNKK